MTTSCQKKGYS